MEAVSDTSPLIFVARVPGLLPLLERLFDTVWVPKAVEREAVTAALLAPQAGVRRSGREVQRLLQDAIFRVAVDQTLLGGLPLGLGAGERAALALARAKRVDWVMLDDRAATRVALKLGRRPLPVSALPLIGVRRGWIEATEAQGLLDALVANQYRLAPHVRRELAERVAGSR